MLWKDESKVLLGPEILFNDLGDRRIKLSNEDKSMLDLEEWNASNVDSFVEKELEHLFFLFWRFSMKTFEDEEVKLDEEEGNLLDSVFKEDG